MIIKKPLHFTRKIIKKYLYKINNKSTKYFYVAVRCGENQSEIFQVVFYQILFETLLLKILIVEQTPFLDYTKSIMISNKRGETSNTLQKNTNLKSRRSPSGCIRSRTFLLIAATRSS